MLENFNAVGPAGNYTGINISSLPGHLGVMPAPFETGPDTFSGGEFLRLKEFTASGFQRSFNALIFDQADAGAFDRIVIDFDFRITCGGQRVRGSGFDFRCADGFSVGWMDTEVVGTTGIPSFNYSGAAGTHPFTLNENGVTGAIVDGLAGRHESFALGFNTFDNLEGSNNSLNAVFNGSGLAPLVNLNTAPFGGCDVVTGSNRTRGAFQHAHIELTLGGPAPSLLVQLSCAVGGLITPFDLDLTGFVANGVPFAPYDGRLGFFTRTGDSQESVDIDNVSVQVERFQQDNDPGDAISVPEPSSLAILGAGLLGAACFRRRRAVASAGT